MIIIIITRKLGTGRLGNIPRLLLLHLSHHHQLMEENTRDSRRNWDTNNNTSNRNRDDTSRPRPTLPILTSRRRWTARTSLNPYPQKTMVSSPSDSDIGEAEVVFFGR